MTEVREHAIPLAGFESATSGDEEPTSGGSNRRTAIIAAVVAAALLIVGAAYFLFLRGGSSSESPSAPVPHSAPAGTGTVAKPAAKPVAKPATGSYAQAVGKDPFKPLVSDQVATTSGSTQSTGSTSTTQSTTGSTTGSTTTVGSTTTTGSTTTGSTTGGAATSPSPISVKLLSVTPTNTSARLTVGTKTYAAAVGDVFATYFKVQRLTDGRCGTFQYGDTSFDLCVGQSTRLQ